MGRVLGAVAKGDLTVRAEVRSRDEVGAMGEAVNTTIADLAGLAGNLQHLLLHFRTA
jgi:methyl-accepting chemotaxis protein